ncbi:MAG: hypothetical protein R6X34_12115 [Chloroflexota bacterium]|jgi:hypothetical protein
MNSPSPALNDPRTVLHVLSFKAALPVLLALLMPDCPRPVSVKWLMMRTGVKSRETVYDSLDFLAELGVVAGIPGANGSSSWWELSDRAFQLPLPVTRPSLPEPQSTQFEETSTQSFLDESTQSHRPGSAQSQDAVIDFGSESTQSRQNLPIVADLSKKSTPPPLNDHDDVFKDHINLNHHHHEIHGGVSKKLTPPPLPETPTAVFLREIGLDDPVPLDYADYPLDAAIGYWWVALVRKMESPQGYLRRRMECGHSRPTDGFWELAGVWLKLSEDQRRLLWQEAIYSHHFSLPDDFPFVPYKPLLRLAHTFSKNKNDGLWFIPDSIAWVEPEEEDDEFMD